MGSAMTAAGLAATCVLASSAAVRGAGALRVRRRLGRATPQLLPAPLWLQRALHDAALPVDTDLVWTIGLGGLVAVALVAALAAGSVAAVVVVGALAAMAAGCLRATAGRRARLVEAALPGFLDSLARSLRSGASLPLALEEAAGSAAPPLAEELALVVSGTALGAGFVESLDRWASASAAPSAPLVAGALGLAAGTGGAAARAIDGLASTLRARVAVAGEVRALSSQARLSAMVIAAAPVAFGALAAGVDGQTLDFLLRRPLGLACLVAGLALDGIAAWWMHRLTVAHTR